MQIAQIWFLITTISCTNARVRTISRSPFLGTKFSKTSLHSGPFSVSITSLVKGKTYGFYISYTNLHVLYQWISINCWINLMLVHGNRNRNTRRNRMIILVSSILLFYEKFSSTLLSIYFCNMYYMITNTSLPSF